MIAFAPLLEAHSRSTRVTRNPRTFPVSSRPGGGSPGLHDHHDRLPRLRGRNRKDGTPALFEHCSRERPVIVQDPRFPDQRAGRPSRKKLTWSTKNVNPAEVRRGSFVSPASRRKTGSSRSASGRARAARSCARFWGRAWSSASTARPPRAVRQTYRRRSNAGSLALDVTVVESFGSTDYLALLGLARPTISVYQVEAGTDGEPDAVGLERRRSIWLRFLLRG